MDSSRAKSVIPETVVRTGFSSWQVTRIKDRLANCKKAVRQGWERISLDILDTDGQDENYVDREGVRPFSESLRRFLSGNQIPSDERLCAVCIYLAEKGYLTVGDLDEEQDALRAPAVIFDFVSSGDDGARERLDALKIYEGSYSHIEEYEHQSEHRYLHNCLSLKFGGGVIIASLTNTHLNRIDTLQRLKNDPAVRQLARKSEQVYQGFVAGMPNGRLIVLVRPKAYDEYYRSAVYLLWAVPEMVDGATSVPAILLMDYPGVNMVEDVVQAQETLVTANPGFGRSPGAPSFAVFDRD